MQSTTLGVKEHDWLLGVEGDVEAMLRGIFGNSYCIYRAAGGGDAADPGLFLGLFVIM